MPDAVELLFNVTVTGDQKVNALAASTKAVGDSAKGAAAGVASLDSAVKTLEGVAGTGTARLSGLAASVALIAEGSQRTNALLLNMTASLDKLTSGAVRTTAAVGGLGAAHRGLVTDTQAASASIRFLEGSQSVRAVEQYTVKVLGLGSAFQAILPAVGAFATLEILYKIGEGIYHVAKAWDPATEAAARYLAVMKGIEGALPGLEKQQRTNSIEAAVLAAEAKHKGSGGEVRSRLEAQYLRQDARQPSIDIDGREWSTVELQNELRRQYLTIQTGSVPDKYGNFGPTNGFSHAMPASPGDIEASKRKIQAYEAALNTLTFKSENLTGEAANKDKQADNSRDDRLSSQARAQLQAINAVLNRVSGIHASAVEGELGPIPRAQAQGQRQLQDALTELNANGGSESNRAEVVSKVNETIRIRVEQELSKLFGPLVDSTSGDRTRFNRPGTVAQADFIPQRRLDLGGFISNTSIGRASDVHSDSKDFSDNLKQTISTEGKELAPLKSAFDKLIDEESKQIQRSASATLRLIEVQAGPGGEGRAVGETYAVRVALAEKLFDIAVQKADIEENSSKQEELLDEAKIKREDELFAARQEHELKIAELQRKSLDDARNTLGHLYDAAFTSKNPSEALRQLGVSQATGLGRTVFQNLAGQPLADITKSIGSALPSTGILGAALKGTFLDSSRYGDPATKTAEHTESIAKYAKDTYDLLAGKTSSDGSSFLSGGAGASGESLGLPVGLAGVGGGGLLSPSTWSVLNSLNPAGISSNPAATSGLLKVLAGGASNFGTGLGAFASGGAPNFIGGLTGNQEQLNADGTWGPVSGATRAGEIAGGAGALIGGGLAAYSGFKQGGIGGISKGVGAIAGTAAAFDPEPISKGILLGVSAISGLVGAIFGQNPQKRDAQITKYLAQSQFLAPVSQTVSSDISGHYTDYGADGRLRTSNLSPFPVVAEPTVNRYNGGFYPVAGSTISPYSQAPQITINQNNSMIDPTGVNGIGSMLATSIQRAMVAGQADGLANTLRNRLNP